MNLYSFFNSSTSYRVRIALALKGLSYEYNGVNLRLGDQTTEEYIQLNPSKGVPILLTDDGMVLTQSMAIIQYLDDKYPKTKLIPEQLSEKMRVLEFSNAIACDIHPINNLRVLDYLMKNFEASSAQKSDWYSHWIAEGFSALESLLSRYGKGTYCFGESPSLADCCLVPQVANALRFGCDLSEYSRVMSVYKSCLEHSAFQLAAPSEQPDYTS